MQNPKELSTFEEDASFNSKINEFNIGYKLLIEGNLRYKEKTIANVAARLLDIINVCRQHFEKQQWLFANRKEINKMFIDIEKIREFLNANGDKGTLCQNFGALQQKFSTAEGVYSHLGCPEETIQRIREQAGNVMLKSFGPKAAAAATGAVAAVIPAAVAIPPIGVPTMVGVGLGASGIAVVITARKVEQAKKNALDDIEKVYRAMFRPRM